jgi:hypothetical protein
MGIRNNPPFNGKRYIGNKAYGHMEVHDLVNENANCQIDEILIGNIVAFDSLQEALNRGFDGCRWCLPEYNTR